MPKAQKNHSSAKETRNQIVEAITTRKKTILEAARENDVPEFLADRWYDILRNGEIFEAISSGKKTILQTARENNVPLSFAHRWYELLGQVDKDALTAKLRRHQEWFKKHRNVGQRQKIFFQDDLRNLVLAGWTLRSVDFSNCDLSSTEFRNCDLRGSDLSKTTGLMPSRLSGCDLETAQLPDTVEFAKGLRRADELGRTAARQTAVLLVIAIATIAIAITVSDASLITNSAAFSIPVLNLSLSTLSFFEIMPLVLVASYAYAKFYILRLWKAVGQLPAVMPDGTWVHYAIFPWFGSSNADKRKTNSWVRKFHHFVISFICNWISPIAIAGLWLRYIPLRESPIQFSVGKESPLIPYVFNIGYTPVILILCMGLSIFMIVVSVQLERAFTHGSKVGSSDESFAISNPLRSTDPEHRIQSSEEIDLGKVLVKAGSWSTVIVVVAVAVDVLSIISCGFNNSSFGIKRPVPFVTTILVGNRYSPFGPCLSFMNTDLSTVLTGWKIGDPEYVRGITPKTHLMPFVIADSSFMESANFDGMNLEGGSFEHTDLLGAEFDRCFCLGSDFNDAKLGGATFDSCYLPYCTFNNTDLHDTVFASSNLCNAVFPYNCRVLKISDCWLYGSNIMYVCSVKSTFNRCSFSPTDPPPGQYSMPNNIFTTGYGADAYGDADSYFVKRKWPTTWQKQRDPNLLIINPGNTFSNCVFRGLTVVADGSKISMSGSIMKNTLLELNEARDDDFSNSTFEGRSIQTSSNVGCIFDGSVFLSEDVSYCDLRGSRFSDCGFTDCQFKDADLRNTNWSGASWSPYQEPDGVYNDGPIDFSGANLSGAKHMSKSRLLDHANTKGATLPEHLDP